MKILIYFYSRTNTSKKVAERLALALDASVEEIIDKKDRSGIKGYVLAGKDSIQKKSTDIESIVSKTEDYDLVIVGAPVWSWTVIPAIRALAEQQKEKINNIAFFLTQGAEPPKQEEIFTQLEELFGKKSKANLQLSTKSVAQDKIAEQIDTFVKNLQIDV